MFFLIIDLEEFAEDSFEPQLKDANNVVVKIHNAFDITCIPPKGLPRPKMWWENPKGHVINDSGRIHVEDMRLIFSEVQEADVGDYTCMAENSVGERQISFSLLISGLQFNPSSIWFCLAYKLNY